MRLRKRSKCRFFSGILTFLFLIGSNLFAQENCREFIKIDSLQAIEIAKGEDFYKEKSPYYLPTVALERLEGLCVWKIESKETQHTKNGHCAQTNGCTILIQYIVYIAIEEGLIVEKNRQERYYPNYE